MPSTDRYLAVLLVALVAGLGAVAAVNVSVDPASVFDLAATASLTPYRSDLGSRTAKADGVAEGNWDVIVLGTSRAAVGFDPHDPVWDGDRVFNLGLPQSNVVETGFALDHALAHQQPDEVWLVVDLLALGDGRRTSADFARSALDPALDPVAYYADKTVGYATLLQSAITMKNAAEGERADYDLAGHHDLRGRPGESARHASLRWLERFLVNPATYGDFTYDPERFALLTAMAERAEVRGARVVVVIAPLHATQLEVIRAAGLWDTFQRFKRDLALLGRDRAVWDTTGYGGPLAEPLPEGQEELTWFHEPSHFRPSLGQLVVQTVRTGEPAGGLPAARLIPDSVDAHLEAIDEARGAWARANPADRAVVEALAACVQEWRAQASTAQTRLLGRTGNPGCADRIDRR